MISQNKKKLKIKKTRSGKCQRNRKHRKKRKKSQLLRSNKTKCNLKAMNRLMLINVLINVFISLGTCWLCLLFTNSNLVSVKEARSSLISCCAHARSVNFCFSFFSLSLSPTLALLPQFHCNLWYTQLHVHFCYGCCWCFYSLLFS